MGLLWVGLILAFVFNEYAFVYGLLAVGSFVLFRLMAAFFDFRCARRILHDDMLIYIEREIGRFFAADTGGAVLRLKNELVEALAKQSAALTGVATAMSQSLADSTVALHKSLTDTASATGIHLVTALEEKLPAITNTIDHAITLWKDSLNDAHRVQADINAAAERFELAGGHILSASDLMASHLQGHSGAMSEQLTALIGAIETMRTTITAFSAGQAALTEQAAYIERNQRALETSLSAYEASLQNLTQNLGEGLGAFINMHGQQAAQTVNEALKSNIEKTLQLQGRMPVKGNEA